MITICKTVAKKMKVKGERILNVMVIWLENVDRKQPPKMGSDMGKTYSK